MRWEDERYVRVYTRDTVDWLALSWDAQALLVQLLRKVDRAGLLPLGRHGKRGVAVAVGHPGRWPCIEPALEELLADGCIEIRAGVLFFKNFIAAQETPQSDKQRKAESRARAADLAAAAAVTNPDASSRNVTTGHETGQNVTPGHAQSRAVTLGHSVLCSAVTDHAVPSDLFSADDIRQSAERIQKGLPGIPPQPTAKPKRKRKSDSDDSDPRHHPLKLALVAAGWPFDGGKDAKNLTAILALADQQEATAGDKAHAEVLRRAAIAWNASGYDMARSLSELRLKWARHDGTNAAPAKTRQHELWEGLQQARREALAREGVPATPEMASAEWIAQTLATWAHTKSGDEDSDRLGTAWGIYAAQAKYLEKGLPVKLFLSPGVLAECLKGAKAEQDYIQDLRSPGHR